MRKIRITKSNGESAIYNPKKIRSTLKRTGAKPRMIDHVVSEVNKQVKSGMTTSALYKLVQTELKKESKHIAHRYSLRSSLLKLGPAGFKFEKYVASILNAYQYNAWVPNEDISGLCVDHEIDVIAEKDGKRIMIEAKFRNKYGDTVNLKDTMATYARFLDLVDGSKSGTCQHFDEAWIITNGSFSDHASQFGTCKDMRMVGWNEPDHSLARMVDHAHLYPITVLDNLKQWELDKLSNRDLMLCKEIASMTPAKLSKKTTIPLKRSGNLIKTCSVIVNGE